MTPIASFSKRVPLLVLSLFVACATALALASESPEERQSALPTSRTLEESVEMLERMGPYYRLTIWTYHNELFHPAWPPASAEARQRGLRELLDRICVETRELVDELKLTRKFAGDLGSSELPKKALADLKRILEIDQKDLPKHLKGCDQGKEPRYFELEEKIREIELKAGRVLKAL